MYAVIHIDLGVQRLLKLKSDELGVTQEELANTYILNGLFEEKDDVNMKSIEEIAELMNVKVDDLDSQLDDLDVDTFEIVSDKKHLTMDEIKEILDNNKEDTESNVKLSDMLGIVESPIKTNSLDEKWKSYDRR